MGSPRCPQAALTWGREPPHRPPELPAGLTEVCDVESEAALDLGCCLSSQGVIQRVVRAQGSLCTLLDHFPQHGPTSEITLYPQLRSSWLAPCPSFCALNSGVCPLGSVGPACSLRGPARRAAVGIVSGILRLPLPSILSLSSQSCTVGYPGPLRSCLKPVVGVCGCWGGKVRPAPGMPMELGAGVA